MHDFFFFFFFKQILTRKNKNDLYIQNTHYVQNTHITSIERQISLYNDYQKLPLFFTNIMYKYFSL